MADIKLESHNIFLIDSRDTSMAPRHSLDRHISPQLPHRQSVERQHKRRVILEEETEEQLPTPVSQTNSDSGELRSSPTIAMENDSIAALGVDSRQLFETIERLESLGIQSTLPSLPKFVVVGDQSAGKSSIVEALCNVSLPRNAGTCTRCPFMITTMSTTNRTWRCEVSIQKKYRYDSTARHTTFERWVEQPLESVTFEVIDNKNLLGDVLQRAQSELLTQAGARVLFSPNVICLKIAGPDLPELAFYDLPGSINVIENDDDQHLVEFVEKLVKSYLVDDKALIMLACASDQDIENSTTFKFIRQCKAEQRCLGVLTKPDLLPELRLNHASRMLNGEIFKLGKGWFVTKQPSQAELNNGITQTQAREREESFFATGLWSTSLACFNDRYGIPHLQSAISRQLRQHILDNIGEIIMRVQTRRDEVHSALQQFRPKDPQPMATIITVLSKVNSSLAQHTQASSDKIDFRLKFNKLKEHFRDHLRAMAPDLDASTSKTMKKAAITPRNADVIMLDSDDDDAADATPTPAARPSSNKRRANDGPASVTKRIKVEATTPSTKSASTPVRKVIFTLPQLQAIKERHTESSLPGQVDSKVHEVIILQSMGGWDNVLDQASATARKHVLDLVTNTLDQDLAPYASCELRPRAQQVARRYAEQLLEEQREEIKDRLACEKYKPATMIDITPNKLIAADELYKKRNTRRMQEVLEKHETDTGKVMSTADKVKRFPEDSMTKPSSSDPFAGVVKLLVLPLAYYRIAADRFADEFALQLEYKLIRVLKENMHSELLKGLGIDQPGICEQLLVEDAERERQRQRLMQEMQRLERAMQELNELPYSHV